MNCEHTFRNSGAQSRIARFLAISQALASILIQSAEQERDGLQRAITGLLKTADIIPLDSFTLVFVGELQVSLGMSGQNAIVLASVVRHLEKTARSESCFLSRNSRDFDDPDVRDKLDQFACRYFADFAEALQYIGTRVGTRNPPPAQ